MKNKQIFKKIFSIAKIFGGIILIGFIVVVFLQRFSDNEISFFNYRMFTVITGSMEPRYVVGDVLISKNVEPSTIKVGDAISYKGKVGSFRDKVITHEVIGIETDENGDYLFRAKGRANIVEDPIVFEDQLYGVIVYKSIILSIIYRIISTKAGFYIFIILPILFVVGSEMISTMLDKEDKRRARLKSD